MSEIFDLLKLEKQVVDKIINDVTYRGHFIKREINTLKVFQDIKDLKKEIDKE